MILPTKYEGFGIVIAEALASSLPVVLFDVPTLKTFNKGILKARPFELDEFTHNIIYLLKNKEEREKLGKEGRDDALQRFDYSIVADNEELAINRALY